MGYVKKVLLPDEKILHIARVTPALYIPGILFIGLALFVARYLKDLDHHLRFLARLGHWFKQYVPDMLIDHFAENLSYALLAYGIYRLIRAYIICFWTELAVTDRRVIAKFGVFETTTTEIDRQKIAGVVIHQTINGKMLNYGEIMLRGYSGHINGLPPISSPYDFQKHVNQRLRW